ncbi:hypothetical protein RN347_03075 [Halomonas sp. PAMB 3264]|uniref:hypothetical protein n=1 Tax=unclassified Halomonas TaxID=2609666 RepID=UPI00289B3864|nr:MULTISPECIES: hypothetical protein [unclassified Halomonas]WNL39532.1 hypothetical protein RN346_02995 [Halomonas sp. PAMB 3232]WNL42889.1 hypothetical protein RN347_03075 [Halomonas sp. PAMB 3264]
MSHLEHVLIGLGIQLLLALLPRVTLWVSGALAVAVFLGREIAQHEYKLAVARGWEWGQTQPVGVLEGVVTGWHLDSVLDVLAPAAGCFLLALGVWAIRQRGR